MGILKALWDALTMSKAQQEEAWRREDAARNARDAAAEDGKRLRELFTGMSDAQQQEWGVEAGLFEDYRFQSPTFVPLWDEHSTLGVCVPGKHDEAEFMHVSVRRKDGESTTKHVAVMFAVCHEVEDKRRWLSVCMILE